MIEPLKDFDLVKKVGGRFKLTSLLQKRMVELMQGSRPLIDDAKGKTMLEVAVQEIVEDKITIEELQDIEKPERPLL